MRSKRLSDNGGAGTESGQGLAFFLELMRSQKDVNLGRVRFRVLV